MLWYYLREVDKQIILNSIYEDERIARKLLVLSGSHIFHFDSHRN